MLDITNTSFNPDVLYVIDGFVKKGTCTHIHHHEFIEMSVILDGPATYHINQTPYLVDTGDIIIINSWTPHFEEQIQGKSHHLHIGVDNVQFIGYEKNQFPLISPVIKSGTIPGTQHVIQRILDEKNAANPYQDLAFKHLVSELWLLILRKVANETLGIHKISKASTSKKELAHSIKYYLEAHHSEDISLESLSSSMYVSPTYVSKLFKEETGDSPINYLIKVRMEKAKELLQQDKSTVKEIAALVGYDDAYHFSKLFKKYTGTSPSEFAKKSRSIT